VVLKGKAYKFGDDVSTDLIISGRWKFSIQDPKELASHVMEDADPEFPNKVRPGSSFIVAGRNWGIGSSREQAPLALKAAGINAIIAKSFARIFYRNSFNIGLPLIECDTSPIDDGDDLELDLRYSRLRDLTMGIEIEVRPLSPIMKRLLEDGGLIEHYKIHGGLKFEP